MASFSVYKPRIIYYNTKQKKKKKKQNKTKQNKTKKKSKPISILMVEIKMIEEIITMSKNNTKSKGEQDLHNFNVFWNMIYIILITLY